NSIEKISRKDGKLQRNISLSRAIDKSEELGRDPVWPGQMIADQPHPRKGDHPVEAVIPPPVRPVPDGDRDIDFLEGIQRVTHLPAVRDARFALDPIPHGHDAIVPIVGVDISPTVSRRGQTRRQGRYIRTPGPREPAKITRLDTIINVANQ